MTTPFRVPVTLGNDLNLTTAGLLSSYLMSRIVAGDTLTADVTTSETTASTTYAALATAGPAVTTTIGPSGIAVVIVSAEVGNGTAADGAYASFDIGGTGAVDADACGMGVCSAAGLRNRCTHVSLLSGLTPGALTFTMKYRAVVAGTAAFLNRRLIVLPL